jgi:hypothetical protein
MPYVPFYSLFPDVAMRETRSVMLLQPSDAGLPPGDYGFVEFFCDEAACDCRRVFFGVMSERSRAVEAVIAYGWESPDFYRRWMRTGDPGDIASLKGPVLNLLSPQSPIAPAILDMFRQTLLPDRAYMDRVQRHYAMFRARIDRTRKRERFQVRKAAGRVR